MGSLQGKVAVITGGASGIGRATAKRLVRDGAAVAIADLDPVGAEVAKEFGALFIPLDVTDPEAWQRALPTVIDELGGLDILHLNAGSHAVPRGQSLGTDALQILTLRGFERVVGINVGGVLFGVIAALPHFEAQGHGDVVVTASLAGLKPLKEDPLYSMSKHAVVGLVRSLAPTLSEHGIRIQAICPGAVDTALPPPELRPAPGSIASPAFLADAVVHMLENGTAGDVWVTIREGEVPWRYDFGRLRDNPGAPTRAEFGT
jgi:NAD(P)-dependent dehydrogenase (short-subunit alcohol dehydrogenase family)